MFRVLRLGFMKKKVHLKRGFCIITEKNCVMQFLEF